VLVALWCLHVFCAVCVVEFDFILGELKIPATGASMAETIAGFQRLLANYSNPHGHRQSPAVVCPPPKPRTPSPQPAPSPAPSPAPAPVVALTQAEREADDLLDRQIKAKKDLLSGTSPVVMAYRDGAEFNKALKELSAGTHPDPPNKAPFVTSGKRICWNCLLAWRLKQPTHLL
jgi:hypothetical protein